MDRRNFIKLYQSFKGVFQHYKCKCEINISLLFETGNVCTHVTMLFMLQVICDHFRISSGQQVTTFSHFEINGKALLISSHCKMFEFFNAFDFSYYSPDCKSGSYIRNS